jgi:hypothetical protein
MIRRPRFRLSTPLWLTLAVACWFGGRASQIGANKRKLLQLEDRLNASERYAKRLDERWKEQAGKLLEETGAPGTMTR